MAFEINLSGQVALVTGANRGIGAATALKLATAGADVVLSGRSSRDLSALADEIMSLTGAMPHIVQADLSDPAAADIIIRSVYSTHRKLDILVNNAGVLSDGVIGTFTQQEFQDTIQINTISALQLIQLSARLMLRKKRGSIINTSSIMATNGAEGQFLYAASKAALIGATKSAARELGPNGIRVNCIAPGLIETDMITGLGESIRAQRVEQIALRRTGKPDEVANLTLFLASNMSSYVNGQIIAVDGMMSL